MDEASNASSMPALSGVLSSNEEASNDCAEVLVIHSKSASRGSALP